MGITGLAMKRIREIVQSNLEPEDKNVLWLDVSNLDDICIKMYEAGDWRVISTSGIFGNYITPSDLANMFVDLSESDYTQIEVKNPNTYYFTYEEE